MKQSFVYSLLASAGAIFSLGVVLPVDVPSSAKLTILLSAACSSGSVTPGIVGRLHGGLIECGELRHCRRNFLSYTILVPVKIEES